MKSYLLLLILVASCFTETALSQVFQSTGSSSAINGESCGFDYIHQQNMQSDSVYSRRTHEFNEALKNLSLPMKVVQTSYKIPVVVHVMSDATALTAITDDEIVNAIKALNEHYRNIPGTIGGGGNGVDMEIEFALAVRDPNDNCTNGIVRYDLSWNSTYTTSGVKLTGTGLDDVTMKSYSVWDQTKYYNIWLVSEIDNNNGGSNTQGYANFASAHGYPSDGTVILASKFKNYSSTVIVHEMGHALNLYHSFEGDASGTTCPVNADCTADGDLLCDTPPHIRSSSNCVVGTNACDGGSSTELFIYNYMDYSSDACRNEYTIGQKTRAIAALTTSRASFLESNGNLSLVPPAIASIDYTSTSSGGCTGTTIQFFDKSSCIPNNLLDTTSWPGVTFNWTFTNNSGTTYVSTLQNPIITFAALGTYDVTLSITNDHGTSSMTQQGFIVIIPPAGAAICNSTSTYTGTLSYGIFGVTLGTLNHTSGSTLDDNTSGLTANGYADISCSEITLLNPNTTYEIGIKGTSNVSLFENFKAYIDYNNDGDFVDVGEEIASWNNITGSASVLTANFTTSATPTYNSLLRLRVISARSTETITPCFVGSRGQCHDFGIYFSNKTAAVSIAAAPSTTISYGTNVTVSATPTNGGASPQYAWYLNGVLQSGQTGSTYVNSTLVDGDQVNCEMTSNLNGVIGSPVNSNVLTFSVTGPPITDFYAQDTVVCTGTAMQFFDSSLLSPTSWNWSFPGGSPSTSNVQNPVITYSTPGTYSVSLITGNTFGTGSNLNQTSYITAYTEPGAPCTAFVRTNTPILGNGIGIKKVKLGSINSETSNIDGVFQSFVCTKRTELKIDTTYTLEVGVSPIYSQWVRVYIDYNNNNSFLDANELVYSNNAAIGTVSTSIATPTSATLNTLLRMRVITDYLGSSTAGPCKSPLDWGQVEDYGVIMKYNCNLPAIPGAITGTTTLCSGSTGIVYSVNAVSGATSYNWTVPAGATITSGQGTTTITVNFGSNSGNIGVSSVKSCGSSAESVLAVTVNSVPVSPVSISGSSTICSGSSGHVYNISAVPGATSYTWSVPSGSTITAGQGTTSATVSFGSTSGNVSVLASNSCGNSALTNKVITVNTVPATPSAISGSVNVCAGTTGNSYSVPAVSGATSYTWSVPSGATISSGQGTPSVTVIFGSTSGNVSVTASNACGTSPASTTAINVYSVPSTPGSISGTIAVCSGSTGNVYSISDVPQATSYTWSVPPGASITAGQGTTSATYTAPVNGTGNIISGSLSVTASNGCGTSSAASIAIELNPVVPIPVVTVTNNCGSSILETNGSNLLWSTGESTSSITVTSAGTYSVTQSIGGCASSDGFGDAVPLQVPSVPVVGVQDNCGYTLLSTSGNALLWSTGETTASISVTAAGVYTVTETLGTCTSLPGSGIASPLTIPPAPMVTVVDNCGSSVLSATGTALNWSTGATTSSITVSSAGTYTVTQTSQGCISANAEGIANPLQNPVVTFSPLSDVCINTPSFFLSGGTPAGGNYSGTGVNSNIFDPSVAGYGTYIITYLYIDVNGCSAEAQQPITVGCAGETEHSLLHAVLYPNPGNGLINVKVSGSQINLIKVYDATGKLVFIEPLKNFENEHIIDLRGFSKGFYLIELNGSERHFRQCYVISE
jgi:PKD repeat protein